MKSDGHRTQQFLVTLIGVGSWLALSMCVHAAPTLTIGELVKSSETTATVPVQLTNDTPVAAIQMDVFYNSAIYTASPARVGTLPDNYRVDSRVVTPGQLRVVVGAPDNSTLVNGILFEIPLSVTEAFPSFFPVTLNGSVLSTATGTPVAAVVAPRVRLQNLTAGQVLTNQGGINLSADAAAGTGQISKVAFYANNVLIGEQTSSPFSFSWVPTTGGAFNLSVVATDANGTQTTSNSVAVVVNRVPVAGTDSFNTPNARPITVTATQLLSNDSDPDGDALSISNVANGSANGTVLLTGSNATYTPVGTFSGTDFFTYTLSDSRGGTATGRVNVTTAAPGPTPTPLGLIDADRDGISDLLETQYFGSLSLGNATTNADGDSISDRDETIAGSNPVLKTNTSILGGLLGWWDFDDDAAGNRVQFGVAGQISGTPEFINGARGRAVRLKGTTDFVDLQTLPAFLPRLTASILVRLDNLPTAATLIPIIDATGGTENFELVASKTGSTWRFRASFRDRLNATQLYPSISVESKSIPRTGQFNHIAITYDAATLALYVNGVKESQAATNKTATTTIAPPPTGPRILLGRNAAATTWLEGALDEMRLYDRALNDSEIRSLYSAIPWSQFGTEWAANAGGNGNRYEIVTPLLALTSPEAFNAATDRGGYLSTITSAGENTFLAQLAVDRLTAGVQPLIGAYRGAGIAGWRWSTSEPFAFTNWRTDAIPTVPAAADQSVRLFNQTGNALHGKWSAANDSETVPAFIVEYERVLPQPTPTPAPAPRPKPAPAPAPDPRLDQLASLEKQLMDARKIKNPKARASKMRLLNSQINSLKAEIAGGGNGGSSANSELAALQKQLADAKRIKNPKIRAKKIAEINAKIAAL
jgi:hypothetical protein